jgi:hypothetical protein
VIHNFNIFPRMFAWRCCSDRSYAPCHCSFLPQSKADGLQPPPSPRDQDGHLQAALDEEPNPLEHHISDEADRLIDTLEKLGLWSLG